MEPITVHVSKDNSVMLCCPYCEFARKVQLDQLKDVKYTFVVRCKCNNRFKINLNLRKCYRKNVTIPGKFMLLSPNGTAWLEMNIYDISRNGIGFKMIEPANINKGNTLRVKFNLDNGKQTLIDKKVIVRVVSNNDFIGCEFSELDLYEKELGFYLMS